MLMSVINIMSHDEVYYFDYSTNLSPISIFARLIFVANCLANLFSWNMVYRYGLGDFSHIRFSGNYSIGYKLYYGSRFGAATSVFYPVDKLHHKLMVQNQG